MDRVAEFACTRPQGFFERIRGSPFDLKHREVNHAVVELATRESGASDICLIPVEIAKRLVLRLERCLKTAYLPNRAYRQYESDCLPVARRGLWPDPHTLGRA